MLLTLVLALALAFVAPTAIAQVNQASDQSSEAGEIGQEFDVSREGGIVEQAPQAAPVLAPCSRARSGPCSRSRACSEGRSGARSRARTEGRGEEGRGQEGREEGAAEDRW